jgi:hypothetical membrane protein
MSSRINFRNNDTVSFLQTETNMSQKIVRGVYAKLPGGLLLASGIVFMLWNTISEGLYPSYSVRTNALSDLGAIGSPTQHIWDGQLFVAGLLGFLGMFILFYRQSALNIGKRTRVGILYLLPTLGTIIVSLFPDNFIGIIHLLGAFLTFLFGGISMVYAYRFTNTPFNYFSVLLGMISLASTPFLGLAPQIDFGLVERLVLYPYIIWNIAFAGSLIGLPPSERLS